MKIFFAYVMRRLLIVLMASCGVFSVAEADNVAMVETSKFMAPETVNLLTQRAANGGPFGLQVGDSITYIIKYKPVPNGGNTGVNGYVTDYIPAGLQVIDAGFVQPDGAGGFFAVPPVPAGDMANFPGANGNRGLALPVGIAALPATPINLLLPGAIAPNAAVGNLDSNGLPTSQGTLAQWYADVGVWYSTDPRTGLNLAAPIGTSRNNWDLLHLNYETVCANNNGGAEGPWGTGSPVAGPETFYQYELLPAPAFPCQAGSVGPWRRIAVPGSRIGDYGLMGDVQASRELLLGDPLYGRDVSANPLPVSTVANPVTLRWADGLNSVGQVKYVSVTARVAFFPPGGAFINESEVWGGDVFYGENGKDNAWKYNDTLVSISNNSSMAVFKQPSVEAAENGDVVSFQVTVINTGAHQHDNVVITDYLNTSQEPGKPGTFMFMSQYNFDASGGGVYTAGPIGNTPGSENITWSLPVLNPGASQTFTYSVTAVDPNNSKFTEASDMAVVTSGQLPLGGTQTSASYTIGTFPLLNQTKTVTPSSALPGGTVRYHIQIINSGAGYAGTYHTTPLPGVSYFPLNGAGLPMSTVIQDTLPTGFTYAGNPSLTINGAPVLGSTLTALGNGLTWSIPHTLLAPNEFTPGGGVLDLYFDAQIDAGLVSGIYTNDAQTTVPYNQNPTNKAPKVNIGKNKSDWATKPLWSLNTAPVTVGAVQMTKATSTATVVNSPSGTVADYTITVTNNGVVATHGIVITDTLPVGFSYKASTTSGTAGIGEPIIIGQNVVWSAFNVPAGSNRTLSFTADIASTVLPAVFKNDVTATASNANIPDVLQTAPVTVTLPGLTVNKTVDRPSVPWLGAGVIAPAIPLTDVVNYTITLTNSGDGYAIVSVSDQLPSGFEYDPLLGFETVTLTVNGAPTVMKRGLAVSYATYPVLPTRTPQWGIFTIPPAQGANNTTLTITFPVRINMAQTPAVGVAAVTAPGSFANQVTVSGNVNVPIFIGASVAIVQPVSKSTRTPSVAVSGLIDYRLQVDNSDTLPWTAVSVVDYLGTLTAAGAPVLTPSGAVFSAGTAYYAIGTSAPLGVPGTDPLWLATTPVSVPPMVTFDNGGGSFSLPAGQSLFVAFSATAPVAVPVPAIIHNSIQTLNYTSNAVARTVTAPYDGGLVANTAENVMVTLTPSVTLVGAKTVVPSSLYLYGAAAPNALTYSITLTNNDLVTAATGISIADTLAAGLSFGVGDTATLSINGGAAIPLTPVWTLPTLTIPLGANVIPPGSTAVITFTASVAALTPANTFFNSATWTGANINTGSIGPAAPVIIDPVSVAKQSLTPSVVAGGVANYRLTVTNSGGEPLNNFTLTDYFGDLTPVLAPSGFTYSADIAVTLNGTALVAGVDYTAPVAASAVPVWVFSTPMLAATPGAPASLVIDFSANIPPTSLAGSFNNSVSQLTFSPGILPLVTSVSPFDGAAVGSISDNVTVSTVGINKSVVPGFETMVLDPLLGATTQYEVVVTNLSAAPQTVMVQDTLPSGFSINPAAAYFSFGVTPPALAPPSAGWMLTTPNTALPQTINTPLFDNAAAGFIVPANQNLYFHFSVGIAATVVPSSYNNQADVRLAVAPTTTVASISGATVTLQAPQVFLSKITTTPNVGKNGLGNYAAAHYRISVLNSGDIAANGVIISDVLPVGFTLTGASVVITNDGFIVPPANYTVTQVGQTVTFIGTVPVGGFFVSAAAGGSDGQLKIEYDAAILNTTPAGLATNSVTVATTNAGTLGPASANVTLTDLGLSKTTSTPNAVTGNTANYTITVNNFGPTGMVVPVVVTDHLPTGFDYPATPTTPTTGTGWVVAEPVLTTGNPVWTIPVDAVSGFSLPAASSITINFDVEVNALVSAGTYYNSVTAISGVTSFPATGPTAPVNAQPSVPLLKVDKVSDALPPPPAVSLVNPGQIVTYTITVRHDPLLSAAEAISVELTDAMSAYTNFGLDSFGVGLPFKLLVTDALPLSPPLTLGTPLYSNDGGVGFSYIPISGNGGASPGFDGNVTNWKIPMSGALSPEDRFELKYKVKVQ